MELKCAYRKAKVFGTDTMPTNVCTCPGRYTPPLTSSERLYLDCDTLVMRWCTRAECIDESTAKDMVEDRITYFEGETTRKGLPSVDEVVLHNGTIHLEKISDSEFVLIGRNAERYYHLVISSRSGKSKIEAHVYEEGK